MISSFSKSLLAGSGFAVSRVSPALRSQSARPRDTKGWLVEFVGPTGVGKSTLFRRVEPMLRRDWFFERHAKGLTGKVVEDEAHAEYLRRICARRLEDLQADRLRFDRVASIGQRVFEVARLGRVTKSQHLPRGFVIDDGLAHFFAEPICEQDREATMAFFSKTAFVFVLPSEADLVGESAAWTRKDLKPYWELLELLSDLGRPTLVLDRNNSRENPSEALSFIQSVRVR